MNDCILRDVEPGDLEMVLLWRNHPMVRANMYTQHEISLSEHSKWFHKMLRDPAKRYLICLCRKEPVGVVGFYGISLVHRTASWAFYSGDLNRRGLGSQMERLALDYAFQNLSLEKLSCEVLSYNYDIVKFHRKHGFEIEGVFRNQYFVGSKYHDVYRLGIFKKNWCSQLENEMSPCIGSEYSHDFVVTESEIGKFADLTGDTNPVHLDDKAARVSGFPHRIVHGFLSGAVFSKIFGTQFPGPGTVYLSQKMTFLAPVFAEQKLQAKLKVVSRIRDRLAIETSIIDAETSRVLVEGEAWVLNRRSGHVA